MSAKDELSYLIMPVDIVSNLLVVTGLLPGYAIAFGGPMAVPHLAFEGAENTYNHDS